MYKLVHTLKLRAHVRSSCACADGAPGHSPSDPETPEQLLVHLTVRGRGTLLAYSSHRPQVGASAGVPATPCVWGGSP